MASAVNQDDTAQRGEDRNHSGAVRPDGGTVRPDNDTVRSDGGAVRIESATGTDNLLYPLAFSIRRTVFGGEQQVPVKRDKDGLDPVCRQYVLFVDDEPAAELRVEPHRNAESSERSGNVKAADNALAAGESKQPSTWQIERVATLARFRGHGYGRMLVDRVLEDARRLGIREVTLHSQIQAIGFYEKLGFEAYGPEFKDAGIRHRRMRIAVSR